MAEESRVRKNAVANLIGNGWSAVMALAFVPIYIKYLGIEAYGIIGLFATLQAWLAVIDLGLSQALCREMALLRGGAREPRLVVELLYAVELIYFGLMALIVASAYVGADWTASHWLNVGTLPVGATAAALFLVGLAIALRFIGGLYRSALIGLQDQIPLNVVTVVFATLRGAGVIAVLAWISPSLYAFFAYQSILAALEALSLRLVVRSTLPRVAAARRFSLEPVRGVARFASGFAAIMFCSLLISQADKVIASAMVPLTDFAHYALAAALAASLNLAVLPINNAFLPRLAQLAASEQAIVQTYHRFAQVVSITAAPLTLVGALFAYPLILAWTRSAETAEATAPILSVLLIGTLINLIVSVPYLSQVALGHTRFVAVSNAVAALFFVPAVIAAILIFGVIGAAWAGLLLNVGFIAVGVPLLHSSVLKGIGWQWLTRDVVPPLFAAAVVALSVKALASVLPSTPAMGVGVALGAVSAATLAAALATTIGRSLLAEFVLRTLAVRGSA